jgi:hypothetical protein
MRAAYELAHAAYQQAPVFILYPDDMSLWDLSFMAIIEE